jgi:hypothetical protein
MYTLRVIIEERSDEKSPFQQVTDNYALGKSYRVAKKDLSKQFDEGIKEFPDKNSDNVRAVLFSKLQETWFIRNNSNNIKYHYYIMTDNGGTLEKL